MQEKHAVSSVTSTAVYTSRNTTEQTRGGLMRNNLQAGENVRHRARANWGIGKITSINSSGTVQVVFEGNKILSIAKGINHLIKVDPQDKEI